MKKINEVKQRVQEQQSVKPVPSPEAVKSTAGQKKKAYAVAQRVSAERAQVPMNSFSRMSAQRTQQSSMPTQWYAGEQPTGRETLAQIYRMTGDNGSRRDELLDLYAQSTQDKASPLYNPYTQATNSKAIAALEELGVDVSGGINDDFFAAYAGYRNYDRTVTGDTPLAPSKTSTREQDVAYWLYQLQKDEANTVQAESELASMADEIKYLVGRGYSDGEIISRIDTTKYATLTAMDKGRAVGVPLGLNRAVNWSGDTIYGMIWAARNDGGSGDYAQDSVRYALGDGKKYVSNPEAEAARDKTNPATYNPYCDGATIEKSRRATGQARFDRAWLDANRGMLTGSKDDEKVWLEVCEAVENHERASAELAELQEYVRERAERGWDVERILGSIDLAKDYKTLAAMEDKRLKGGALELSDSIDFTMPAFTRWVDIAVNGDGEQGGKLIASLRDKTGEAAGSALDARPAATAPTRGAVIAPAQQSAAPAQEPTAPAQDDAATSAQPSTPIQQNISPERAAMLEQLSTSTQQLMPNVPPPPKQTTFSYEQFDQTATVDDAANLVKDLAAYLRGEGADNETVQNWLKQYGHILSGEHTIQGTLDARRDDRKLAGETAYAALKLADEAGLNATDMAALAFKIGRDCDQAKAAGMPIDEWYDSDLGAAAKAELEEAEADMRAKMEEEERNLQEIRRAKNEAKFHLLSRYDANGDLTDEELAYCEYVRAQPVDAIMEADKDFTALADDVRKVARAQSGWDVNDDSMIASGANTAAADAVGLLAQSYLKADMQNAAAMGLSWSEYTEMFPDRVTDANALVERATAEFNSVWREYGESLNAKLTAAQDITDRLQQQELDADRTRQQSVEYGEGVGFWTASGKGVEHAWHSHLGDTTNWIDYFFLNGTDAGIERMMRDKYNNDPQAYIEAARESISKLEDPEERAYWEQRLEEDRNAFDLGYNMNAEGIHQFMYDRKKALSAIESYMQQNGTYNENVWMNMVSSTTDNVLRLTESAILTAATGGSGGIAADIARTTLVYGLSEGAQLGQRLEAQGADPYAARAFGMVQALWVGASESIVEINYMPESLRRGQMLLGGDLARLGAHKLMTENPAAFVRLTDRLMSGAARVGLNALAEGTQEFTQGVGSTLIEDVGTAATTGKPFKATYDMREGAQEFAMGALMSPILTLYGAGMNLPGKGVNYLIGRMIEAPDAQLAKVLSRALAKKDNPESDDFDYGLGSDDRPYDRETWDDDYVPHKGEPRYEDNEGDEDYGVLGDSEEIELMLEPYGFGSDGGTVLDAHNDPDSDTSLDMDDDPDDKYIITEEDESLFAEVFRAFDEDYRLDELQFKARDASIDRRTVEIMSGNQEALQPVMDIDAQKQAATASAQEQIDELEEQYANNYAARSEAADRYAEIVNAIVENPTDQNLQQQLDEVARECTELKRISDELQAQLSEAGKAYHAQMEQFEADKNAIIDSIYDNAHVQAEKEVDKEIARRRRRYEIIKQLEGEYEYTKFNADQTLDVTRREVEREASRRSKRKAEHDIEHEIEHDVEVLRTRHKAERAKAALDRARAIYAEEYYRPGTKAAQDARTQRVQAEQAIEAAESALREEDMREAVSKSGLFDARARAEYAADSAQADSVQIDDVQVDGVQSDGVQSDGVQISDAQVSSGQTDNIQADRLQADSAQVDGSQTDDVIRAARANAVGTPINRGNEQNRANNEPARRELSNPIRIAQSLAHELGVGAYIGTNRNVPEGMRGYYHTRDRYIATNNQNASNYSASMHEIGHALASRLQMTGTADMVNALPQEFHDSYTANELPGEAFAEFVSTYMLDPRAAQQFSGASFMRTFEDGMRENGIYDAVQEHAQALRYFAARSSNERVGAMIVDKADARKESGGVRGFMRKLITNGLDRAHPADAVDDVVRELYGAENAKLYEALRYRVYHERMAERCITSALVDPTGRIVGNSLAQRMFDATRGTKLGWNELSDYVNRFALARHALDRSAVGKPVFGGDISDNALMDTIETIRREHPEVERAADVLTSWYNDFFQVWLVDTGLVSQETFNRFRTDYPHYVPTFRNVAGNAAGGGRRGTFTLRGAVQGGSDLEVINPVDSLMDMTASIVRTVARNEVGKVFDAQYQLGGLGEFARPVPSARRNYEDQLLNGEADENGFTHMIDAITALGNNGDTLNVVLENGEVHSYEFNDKLLFDALANTGRETARTGLEIVGKLTRTMSALTTGSNPLFAPRNTAKDLQNAIDYGSFATSYADGVAKWAAAAAEIVRNSEGYQEWRNMGGGGWSVLNSGDVKSAKEQRRAIFNRKESRRKGSVARKSAGEKTIELLTLSDMNQLSEEATRLAEYLYGKHDRSTAEGRREAFMASQNVTVDFASGGASQFYRILKQVMPFVGPKLQGVYRTARMFDASERSRLAPRLAKTLFNTGLKAALQVYLIQGWRGMLRNLGLWDDDEISEIEREYGDLAEDVRATNFIIPLPKGWGRPFARIPIEEDVLGQALYGMMLHGWSKGEDADAFSVDMLGLAGRILSDSVPDVTSGTIFAPLIAVQSNTAWHGGKIVSGGMQDKYVTQQYNESTPEPFIRLSCALDAGLGIKIAPLHLKYVAEQYTGIIGKIAIPLMSRDKYTGAWDMQTALNGVKSSIVNQYTIDPAYTNDVTDAYYSQRDKLEQVVQAGKSGSSMNMIGYSLDAARGADAYDEAREMLGKNGVFSETDDIIKELYEEIDEIYQRDDLSMGDKEQMSREKRYLIMDAMKEALLEMEGFDSRYATNPMMDLFTALFGKAENVDVQ